MIMRNIGQRAALHSMLTLVRFRSLDGESRLPKFARCFALACSLVLAAFSLHAQAGAKPADKDLIELQQYTLTMDKVTRCFQTLADFKKLQKANPQLATSIDSSGKNESITEITKRLSAFPQVPPIVQSHGFEVREFVVLELTVFQSAFAVAAKKMGADPAKLASEAHVNPANITFMEQHEVEFAELQKKYPIDDDN